MFLFHVKKLQPHTFAFRSSTKPVYLVKEKHLDKASTGINWHKIPSKVQRHREKTGRRGTRKITVKLFINETSGYCRLMHIVWNVYKPWFRAHWIMVCLSNSGHNPYRPGSNTQSHSSRLDLGPAVCLQTFVICFFCGWCLIRLKQQKTLCKI